jgi:uncharacterized protein (DUF1697 family)
VSGVAVAMLRAVNVGGTNRLAMSDLRALCEGLGLTDVRTYIQSGNVVFRSRLDERALVEGLGGALEGHLGKPVGVLVRTADELDAVLRQNPFAEEPSNRAHVIFLPAAAPSDALESVVASGGERVVVEGREVYVHYPDGAGRSKLKLPFAKAGTARNVNTVTRLAELAHTLSSD